MVVVAGRRRARRRGAAGARRRSPPSGGRVLRRPPDLRARSADGDPLGPALVWSDRRAGDGGRRPWRRRRRTGARTSVRRRHRACVLDAGFGGGQGGMARAPRARADRGARDGCWPRGTCWRGASPARCAPTPPWPPPPACTTRRPVPTGRAGTVRGRAGPRPVGAVGRLVGDARRPAAPLRPSAAVVGTLLAGRRRRARAPRRRSRRDRRRGPRLRGPRRRAPRRPAHGVVGHDRQRVGARRRPRRRDRPTP